MKTVEELASYLQWEDWSKNGKEYEWSTHLYPTALNRSEKNKVVHLAFIDIPKKFRAMKNIVKTIQYLGVPDKVIDIVKNLY